MTDLPTTGALVSDLRHVQLHDSGWVRLPSGVEITRLPLWDDEHQLFARLGWAAAGEWLKAQGWRLPTVAELQELHAMALHIEPYPLPTREMCEAEGVPYNWEDHRYKALQAEQMRSHSWCAEHDEAVIERYANLPRPALEHPGPHSVGEVWPACANAGKHWCAPPGTIYGWWKDDGTMWQNPSRFHAGEPDYTDYATTVHAVRDADGDSDDVDTGGDTDSPPPSSGEIIDENGNSGHLDRHPPESWRPVLRRGMSGPDVAAWQTQLVTDGAGGTLVDDRMLSIAIDGDFGPLTEAATKQWQRQRELQADGVVGPITRAAIGSPPVPGPDPEPPPPVIVVPESDWTDDLELLRAKHYTPGPRDIVDWIIPHSTENRPTDEHGTPLDFSDDTIRPWVALGVGRWFAGQDWRGRPVTAPQASSHYVVGGDPDPAHGVVWCLPETDIAWTAGRRAVNNRAVQIELVGQAARTDWSSPVMRTTLQRAATLSARSCDRWDIPMREVATENLREARRLLEADPDCELPERCRGFISHADVTEVWEVYGGHQDPGLANDRRWPWPLFLGLVDDAMRARVEAAGRRT
jgi:hypothetical protein